MTLWDDLSPCRWPFTANHAQTAQTWEIWIQKLLVGLVADLLAGWILQNGNAKKHHIVTVVSILKPYSMKLTSQFSQDITLPLTSPSPAAGGPQSFLRWAHCDAGMDDMKCVQQIDVIEGFITHTHYIYNICITDLHNYIYIYIYNICDAESTAGTWLHMIQYL